MTELGKYRAEIDAADLDIVSALSRRFDAVTKINEYKHANSLPITDNGREAELLERISALAPDAYRDALLSVYNSILAASREYQKLLRGVK